MACNPSTVLDARIHVAYRKYLHQEVHMYSAQMLKTQKHRGTKSCPWTCAVFCGAKVMNILGTREERFAKPECCIFHDNFATLPLSDGTIQHLATFKSTLCSGELPDRLQVARFRKLNCFRYCSMYGQQSYKTISTIQILSTALAHGPKHG